MSIPHENHRRIVVGVDTHKHNHVAVALDQVGAGLDTISVNRAGYAQPSDWAVGLAAEYDSGQVLFGIEGTGSYGAGLASFLRRAGDQVVEANRGDRTVRHLRGKDDTIDAETAARSVLSGTATAVPKTGDGTVEMIRQIEIAKDTATKARTQAVVTLKTILVNAAPSRPAGRRRSWWSRTRSGVRSAGLGHSHRHRRQSSTWRRSTPSSGAARQVRSAPGARARLECRFRSLGAPTRANVAPGCPG